MFKSGVKKQMCRSASNKVIRISALASLFFIALSANASPGVSIGNYKGSPHSTWDSLSETLEVHTFNLNVANGRSHLRRFLLYKPKAHATDKKLPLVIALPGANTSAEFLRHTEFGDRFEQLADRESFYLVYANAYSVSGEAAPEVADDVYWANPGYWRTCVGSPQAKENFYEVDDIRYIEKLIQHAQDTTKNIDTARIYVTGVSNGGEMALHVARMIPDQIAASAAVNPVMGLPASSPLNQCEAASRQEPISLMIMYSPQDPTLVPIFDSMGFNYAEAIENAASEWSKALGHNSNPEVSHLPNSIHEGRGYSGASHAANSTMNGYIERLDHSESSYGTKFSLVRIHRGGHGWPNKQGDPWENAETWGFRNQDINAEILIWDFFKDKWLWASR
jgi:poly(3-hydroxybutyrate) depolymerase